MKTTKPVTATILHTDSVIQKTCAAVEGTWTSMAVVAMSACRLWQASLMTWMKVHKT